MARLSTSGTFGMGFLFSAGISQTWFTPEHRSTEKLKAESFEVFTLQLKIISLFPHGGHSLHHDMLVDSVF